MAAFVAESQNDAVPREVALDIFNEFDADKSGTIDAGEFQVVAAALGNIMTDEAVAEAMATLDSDQNGSIDFEEFLAWINTNNSDAEEGNAWEMAALKAQLKARYYRKKASNSMAAMKNKLQGKPPAKGATTLNIDINIDEPKEDGVQVQFNKLESGDGQNSVAAILTLKEGTTQEQADRLCTLLTGAMEFMPVKQHIQMIPKCEGLVYETVDYLGALAIRVKLNFVSDMNPAATLLKKTHVDITTVATDAVRLSFGSNIESLLDGTATPRDFCKGRFQAHVVFPAELMGGLRHMPVPEPVKAMLFLRTINFELLFGDLNQMVKEMGFFPQQEILDKFMDTKMGGITSLLAGGVKYMRAQIEAAGEQVPEEFQTLNKNYDAFEILLGFAGVQCRANTAGFDIVVSNFSPFLLLPSEEAADGAADISEALESKDPSALLDEDMGGLWSLVKDAM